MISLYAAGTTLRSLADSDENSSVRFVSAKSDFHGRLREIQGRLDEIGKKLEKIAEELSKIKAKLEDIGKALQALQDKLGLVTTSKAHTPPPKSTLTQPPIVSPSPVTATASPLFTANSTYLPISSLSEIKFPTDVDKSKILVLVDVDGTVLFEGPHKPKPIPNALDAVNSWMPQKYTVRFFTAAQGIGLPQQYKDMVWSAGRDKSTWLRDNWDKDKLISQYNHIVFVDNWEYKLTGIRETLKTLFPSKPLDCYYFGDPRPTGFPPSMDTGYSLGAPLNLYMPLFQVKKGEAETNFIAKKEKTATDFTGKTDHVSIIKEEILANALYAAIAKADSSFGINIPPFSVYHSIGGAHRSKHPSGGEFGGTCLYLVSKFIDKLSGKDRVDPATDKIPVMPGFIVDAFLANWDVKAENLFVGGIGGKLYRTNVCGALRRRPRGLLKTTEAGYDPSDAAMDIAILRGLPYRKHDGTIINIKKEGRQFFSDITDSEIDKQIRQFLPLGDTILKTVDQWHKWLDIDGNENLISNLEARLRSLVAYLKDKVRADSFKTASASVLMHTIVDGRTKILLARKDYGKTTRGTYGDFGGSRDATDSALAYTALREAKEETSDLFKPDLSNASWNDLISPGGSHVHRTFIAPHNFINPTIFKTRYDASKKGDKTVDHHITEHDNVLWVDLATLLAFVEAHNECGTKDNGASRQYTIPDLLDTIPSFKDTRPKEDRSVAIYFALMHSLRQKPILAELQKLLTPAQQQELPGKIAHMIQEIPKLK